MEDITWVYVTRTGTRFYKNPNSGYLRGRGARVPIESAITLGYSKAQRGY